MDPADNVSAVECHLTCMYFLLYLTYFFVYTGLQTMKTTTMIGDGVTKQVVTTLGET